MLLFVSMKIKKGKKNERATLQKRAIEDLFDRADHPMTIKEIHIKALKEVRDIGIATIYRAIAKLLVEKQIVKVILPNSPVCFERLNKSDTHHHHFKCNRCEKVFDLVGCIGSYDKLVPSGFLLVDHEVNLYGYCKDCR